MAKETKLTPEEAPATQALILICEKCGKKLGSDRDDNPSRTLQKSLKNQIKSEGKKSFFRAVLTGCLDLCPKGAVALAISPINGRTQFFTVENTDMEVVAKTLLKELKGRA